MSGNNDALASARGRIAPDTKRYAHVANHTDLTRTTLEQVQHFFEHYKDLEPESGKMQGWGDAAEAKVLIGEAITRAKAVGAR
jgi:inorganic pyrophosphatase